MKILTFLMYGPRHNTGRDTTMKLHPDGQVKAISVNGHWYEVVYLIYSLQSMIRQGITIWLVICNGKYYMLKDSWIQTSRVGSEIEFLKKLKGDPKLQGHVPHIVEGEDIYIGGFVDSTRWYHTYVGGLHDACSHRRLVMTPIGKQSLLSSRLLNSSMHSLTSLEVSDQISSTFLPNLVSISSQTPIRASQDASPRYQPKQSDVSSS